MDNYHLWSLRLGFTGKQAGAIKEGGINNFLKNSFNTKPDNTLPSFLVNEPKTPQELKAARDEASKEKKLNVLRNNIKNTSYSLKGWWIDKMMQDKYPLREKMTVFLHNHYVCELQNVESNYWIYTHNQLLRENCFGNFRELTKKVLKTNAMIRYLDNDKNVKGKYNENLSRELLELFTLGIGNYSENDIKNGAKGLAGLTNGPEGGIINPAKEFKEDFTYFGQTGNFKSDEMVDIIFKQKSAPYFFTRKILKWFIYDDPPAELVTYYGDYFRQQDFEIKPLLLKIFTEEFDKPTAGSAIKDPLVYMLQLLDELNIKNQNSKFIALFLKSQAMDLFNQPNVKGWPGGRYWLTAQLYLQRSNTADKLCKGQNSAKSALDSISPGDNNYVGKFDVEVDWDKAGNNKDVIAQLANRLMFRTDENLQKDFETILRYDFDPNGDSADNGVMRLFNYIVKTPEFQLI